LCGQPESETAPQSRKIRQGSTSDDDAYTIVEA
jgi:hypothetical protein